MTAVEPLDDMRTMLERVVPGVTALPGSAERIPLRDESVDGVFAAQAFHWFDKPVALPEIARVLRARGIFALVWNQGDDDRPDPRPPSSCTRSSCSTTRRCGAGRASLSGRICCATALCSQRCTTEHLVAHDHVLDRAGILDNLRSVSWIASRDDREAVVARLGALLPEATYTIPNRANLIWARKR